MQKVRSIGEPPWTRDHLRAKLREFETLYKERPIKDNRGGMGIVHMFYAWFTLQLLQPKVIVESGVFLGQGTWFFERACPNAEIYCIEPGLKDIQYHSPTATYTDRDFSSIYWGDLPKTETLLFFDDHQNAYERLKTVKWGGFHHVMFEDNYSAHTGDVYSLKSAFMDSGFTPSPPMTLKAKLKHYAKALMREEGHTPVLPNSADRQYLVNNIDVYYEFPPVFKLTRTRWGDEWAEPRYPTPEPLLQSVTESHEQAYFDDAAHYTWMCYVYLK